MIRSRWRPVAGLAVVLVATWIQTTNMRAAIRDNNRWMAEQARISEAWKATHRPRTGAPPRIEDLQAQLNAEQKLRDLYSEQAFAERYESIDQRRFAVIGYLTMMIAGLGLMTADIRWTPKVPARCPTPV